jgi:diguanylate cyclase (GGDEF)-like protein
MTREPCDGQYRGHFEECRASGRRFQLAGRMACETCVLQDRCELERKVDSDELTGLPNRRAVKNHFELLQADGEDFAIALIDLNSLRCANNYISHAFGDSVLTLAGQSMARAKVREADDYMIGRFGGDEFIALARLQSRDGQQDTLYSRFYNLLTRQNVDLRNIEQLKNFNQTVKPEEELGIKFSIVIHSAQEPRTFEDIMDQLGPKHTFIRDSHTELVADTPDDILSWAVSRASRLLGR